MSHLLFVVPFVEVVFYPLFVLLVLFGVFSVGGDYSDLDESSPSPWWGTFWMILGLFLLHYRYHLSTYMLVITIPSWLFIGAVYSIFAWYKASRDLRSRILKWAETTDISREGFGTSSIRFLGDRIELKYGKNKKLSDILEDVTENMQPSRNKRQLIFWGGIWPFYLLKLVSKDALNGVVKSLRKVYISVERKAMQGD